MIGLNGFRQYPGDKIFSAQFGRPAAGTDVAQLRLKLRPSQ
jgi:hypothetical protein